MHNIAKPRLNPKSHSWILFYYGCAGIGTISKPESELGGRVAYMMANCPFKGFGAALWTSGLSIFLSDAGL